MSSFREVADRVGLRDDLGCVMAKFTPAAKLRDAIPEKHLYLDPAKPDDYGREQDAHVTLLYGLVFSPKTDRDEVVDLALMNWSPPKTTFFRSAGYFAPEGEPYEVVYLQPLDNSAFADAHERLSWIPHVNPQRVYKPHLTLAYVKRGRASQLADYINILMRETTTELTYIGLDYGK